MTNRKLTERLKSLRKYYGYKQADVAAALDISRQSYSHYETGKRTPSHEILYKTAQFYNITLDELLANTVAVDSDLFFTSDQTNHTAEVSAEYLSHFNTDTNKKKYQFHTVLEKELLYYFEKLSEADKKEIIEFTKIKVKRQ